MSCEISCQLWYSGSLGLTGRFDVSCQWWSAPYYITTKTLYIVRSQWTGYWVVNGDMLLTECELTCQWWYSTGCDAWAIGGDCRCQRMNVDHATRTVCIPIFSLVQCTLVDCLSFHKLCFNLSILWELILYPVFILRQDNT